MRSKGKLAATAVIVAMLVMPLSVQARMGKGNMGQRGMMGRKGGTHAYLKQCLEQLNLTDTQKEEIATILTKHKTERDALQEKQAKARENLRTVLSADDSTEGQIRAAWRKVSSVKEDMLLLRYKTKKEVFGVLTPQQQKQVKEMASKAMKRMKRGRQERERMIMNWLKGETGR